MLETSFIQDLFADRIGGKNFGQQKTLYKFEKIKRAKNQAKALQPTVPLIDLGIGEPDEKAFQPVIDSLKHAVEKHENRGYADNGSVFFKNAIAEYMHHVFSVKLDPNTEICHCIGGKSALSILPKCFINPGDYVIATTPGYPVLGTHTQYLGGYIYTLPLKEKNNYLPVLSEIPEHILKKTKVLLLNYPNNPTGACASIDFYKEVIAFAKKHKIIVIQDAAYATLVYGRKPLSILQVDGAKDVSVEIHSLSKSFNMTGWRLGWICGNAWIVKAFADVKDTSDSGQFLAIQEAGAVALKNYPLTNNIVEKYERRLRALSSILNKHGFRSKPPTGTFFLFTRTPKAVQNLSMTIEFNKAEDFCEWLILEKLISSVPWDEVEPSVRFSATFEADNIQKEEVILNEIDNRLSCCRFIF